MLNKRSLGFSVIEIAIVIALINIGMLGIFGLVQITLTASSNSSNQLNAFYLAQEGIEIVRNIRDANWLKQRSDPAISWDDGLGSGAWEVSYNSTSLESYQDRYLKRDPNSGSFNYSSGNDTIFKRKIVIKRPATNSLDVKVEVSWNERGKSHTVRAETLLYNWLNK